MINKNLGFQLVAIASIVIFVIAEINYDLHSTEELPLDMVKYWYTPLSIMFVVCSFCAFRLTQYKGLKMFFWLLFLLSSSWIMRFICNYKNETLYSEYWWLPLYIFSSYFIVYKKKIKK